MGFLKEIGGRKILPISMLRSFVLQILLALVLLLSFDQDVSCQRSGGQFFTPGLVIVNSPSPNSEHQVGKSLVFSLEITGDGILPPSNADPDSKLATSILSLEIYLISRDMNLTISQGPDLLKGEKGSSVKHFKFPIPKCLPFGPYQVAYHEMDRINGNVYYSVYSLPLKIKADTNSESEEEITVNQEGSTTCNGARPPSPKIIDSRASEQPFLKKGVSAYQLSTKKIEDSEAKVKELFKPDVKQTSFIITEEPEPTESQDKKEAEPPAEKSTDDKAANKNDDVKKESQKQNPPPQASSSTNTTASPPAKSETNSSSPVPIPLLEAEPPKTPPPSESRDEVPPTEKEPPNPSNPGEDSKKEPSKEEKENGQPKDKDPSKPIETSNENNLPPDNPLEKQSEESINFTPQPVINVPLSSKFHEPNSGGSIWLAGFFGSPDKKQADFTQASTNEVTDSEANVQGDTIKYFGPANQGKHPKLDFSVPIVAKTSGGSQNLVTLNFILLFLISINFILFT